MKPFDEIDGGMADRTNTGMVGKTSDKTDDEANDSSSKSTVSLQPQLHPCGFSTMCP